MFAGSSQLNVTCDSVWLDWESTSLSPKSDISHTTTASGECSELKMDSTRSFLENLPTMGSTESLSPKCASPVVVKCYPGCTNAKDRSKAKDVPALKKFFCHDSKLRSVLKLHNCHLKFNTPTKDAKKNPAVTENVKKGLVFLLLFSYFFYFLFIFIHVLCSVPKFVSVDLNSCYKCYAGVKEVVQDRYLVPYTSARFEKRFIEMDEELMSNVTDMDGLFIHIYFLLVYLV